MADDCLFCKIVAGEVPSDRVYEDDVAIAFRDINPQAPTHVLVIPREHIVDLRELGGRPDIAGPYLKAVAASAQQIAAKALEKLGADGVNLLNSSGAAAWQTVFHFHMHVIPRYEGDPLRLPWVPASGDMEEIAAAAKLLAG